MKVQDILTDESKWCKGAFPDIHGQRCLAGAVLDAYSGTPDISYIMNKLRYRFGFERNAISGWNDAPERTFSEVRALIEELDI